MNPAFVGLLRALSEADARYLIVGAYAVTFHSRPRATGDLDIWVEATPGNAARVMRALEAFGAPLQELSAADLVTPGIVYQIGVPPRRIDILTSLTGLTFDEAWRGHVTGPFGDLECPFIGRAELARNKRALGRPRDLADLEMLGESG
ncbi:MAG: hypothetical protein E6K81_14320 [Candidatus Eisenbacteria bacterium]|uniref:Nucleotidyltransferase family protein n=1 Tax=Eiseniibacteriota bacterium TaxID=2212470 RepID=A0A538U1D4_UNCEI|nr:MAG: hypothetical protein E6K81_14320 [Candidatus Eisenbacteria bacterium]